MGGWCAQNTSFILFPPWGAVFDAVTYSSTQSATFYSDVKKCDRPKIFGMTDPYEVYHQNIIKFLKIKHLSRACTRACKIVV